ncbi:MAG: hypothetical protein E7K47_09270, partial [Acidovorax sp.]|nr:hypothetical protein [Acidovorax sp.]
MDKYLLAPCGWGNKAKATFIVPLCDAAFKTHALPLCCQQSSHARLVEHGDAQRLGLLQLAARLGPGDILVFLPGEREIREAAEALRKHALARPGLSTAHAPEILPLFSRLSAGEQDRIFKPSGG